MPGMFCPHYHHKDRRRACRRMVRARGGFAVAVDDGAAVEIVGDCFRVLATARGAGVWTLWRRRGRVIERRIDKRRDLRPLTELYCDKDVSVATPTRSA